MLGNVVSSGIKVMVLAVIVGLGANFFTEFTTALQGQEPGIGQAMSLMLARLVRERRGNRSGVEGSDRASLVRHHPPIR